MWILTTIKVVEYVYIQDGTLDLSGNAFVMATDDGYQVMKDGSTSYDYLNSAWVGTTLTNSVVKDTSSPMETSAPWLVAWGFLTM